MEEEEVERMARVGGQQKALAVAWMMELKEWVEVEAGVGLVGGLVEPEVGPFHCNFLC